MVQVEAARIPDRDRLLASCGRSGLDARAVGEVGIEVPTGTLAESVADELFAQAEHVIMSIGAPFVPHEARGHDLHPPAGLLEQVRRRQLLGEQPPEPLRIAVDPARARRVAVGVRGRRTSARSGRR